MSRGRKPVAPELRVIGANGKRGADLSPKATKGRPVCPGWFGDEARELWNAVVPELESMGVLATIDGAVLNGLCANYQKAVDAERTITEEGATFTGEKGMIHRHPAVGIASECWALVARYQAEIGLSPAARGRLKTVPKNKESKLDRFLNRRG